MEKGRKNFNPGCPFCTSVPGLTQPLPDQSATGDGKSPSDICTAQTFKYPAHLEQAWQFNPPEG